MFGKEFELLLRVLQLLLGVGVIRVGGQSAACESDTLGKLNNSLRRFLRPTDILESIQGLLGFRCNPLPSPFPETEIADDLPRSGLNRIGIGVCQ
ncbi:hypothetical protein D3C84_456890 [compost metagenome]